MSNIYKGELQDNNGNTIYPHTEADIVFCVDGETVQDKLTNYEDALGNVTGKTDSLEVNDTNVLATSKALYKLTEKIFFGELIKNEIKVGTTDGNGLIFIGNKPGRIPIMAYTQDLNDYYKMIILANNDGTFAVQLLYTDGNPVKNHTVQYNVVWALYVV